MKPDPVISFRDEDEAACDARGGALSASLVECLRQPRDAAVLPRASDARSAPSGATPVDLDRNYRRLQERARDLESQVDRHRCEYDRLREALEEAREGHQRSAAAVAAVSEDLRRSELEGQQSGEQLARTTDELVRCQLERRFLRDDVLVKDAYLATLRQQATLGQQSHADVRALTERLDDLTTEHAAEMKRAADLALSNREIRQQLERAQQELHRVQASIADTLAQPRYVVADRCNAWARKARFLHAALKRVWAAWCRGH